MKTKFKEEEPYDPWVRWTTGVGSYLDIIREFSYAENYISKYDTHTRLPLWWLGV